MIRGDVAEVVAVGDEGRCVDDTDAGDGVDVSVVALEALVALDELKDMLLALLDTLLQGLDALLGVAQDEAHRLALGCGVCKVGRPDLLLGLLLHQLVTVEEEHLQLAYGLI